MLVNPDCFENRVKEVALKKASATASASTDGSAGHAEGPPPKTSGEGGDGDLKSESGGSADGADPLGSTEHPPEGTETPLQQQGSVGQMSASCTAPAAEESGGHASNAHRDQNGEVEAVSRLAASASPLSPGSGCPGRDPVPLVAGRMVWPPAPNTPEIRQHTTSILNLGVVGGSGSGVACAAAPSVSVSGAGAGSPRRDTSKITRAEPGRGDGDGSDGSASGIHERGPSLRSGRVPPIGQRRGVGATGGGEEPSVEPQGEELPLEPGGERDGEPGGGLPLSLPVAMEVEAEEDPLPSRAGEIVGGGRTREKGRAPSSSPPASAMGPGASPRASAGSGAGCTPSDNDEHTRSAENSRASVSPPGHSSSSTPRLVSGGACAADGAAGAGVKRRRRRPPGGTETETKCAEGVSSQATAGPGSAVANTVASGAVRRRKKPNQPQSQGSGKETGRAAGGGKHTRARKAADAEEDVGECSLLTMFDGKQKLASSSSSSSSKRAAGRRGVGVTAGVDMADVVDMVDDEDGEDGDVAPIDAAAATTAEGASGSEEEVSEDLNGDGDGNADAYAGGLRRPGDVDGDCDGEGEGKGGNGGGASAMEWRVHPDASKQQRIDDGRDGPPPAQYGSSCGTWMSSLAAARDSGTSTAKATRPDAGPVMSVEEGQGQEEEDTEDVAASAQRASENANANANADGTILAGRTRSRTSRSASCDGKKHRLSQQQPAAAAAEAGAGAGADTGAGADMVPTTAPVVDERVLRESGGGGEVADRSAGGGDPLPLPRRSSSDASLDRKAEGEGGGGGEAAVDDKTPIPCMLLLDSTKGHRSQEMFRMVRK